MYEYEIGYSWARQLRKLVESSKQDAAIDRLEAGKGTDRDLETCARMLERAGDFEGAAELRRIL